MLAGYKKYNRHKRWIHKLQLKDRSTSDWAHRINIGYIKCKQKIGAMEPKDIRKQQMYKLQKFPLYRTWYKKRLCNANMKCSMKSGMLVYEF